jgi:GNAT superfamily N-acetyltransferase
MWNQLPVGLLSVDPDKQRLGVGRRLHEVPGRFCRENEYKVIEGVVINLNKTVLERNKRLGYEVVGTVSSENLSEYADQVNGRWHFIKIEKLL